MTESNTARTAGRAGRIGAQRLVLGGLLLGLVAGWAYSCASTAPTARWSASSDADVTAADDLAGAVQVTGELDAALAPGRSEALDLRLANLSDGPVTVRRVVVRLEDVAAPRATAARGCGPRDFRVRQGEVSGLRLDAGARVLLSETGLDDSRWPRLAMRERPVDQDGCQGSALGLGFRVTGVAR